MLGVGFRFRVVIDIRRIILQVLVSSVLTHITVKITTICRSRADFFQVGKPEGMLLFQHFYFHLSMVSVCIFAK